MIVPGASSALLAPLPVDLMNENPLSHLTLRLSPAGHDLYAVSTVANFVRGALRGGFGCTAPPVPPGLCLEGYLASESSTILSKPLSAMLSSNCEEMCSGFEEGSYSRLIDFCIRSILGPTVMKKGKKKVPSEPLSTTPGNSKGSSCRPPSGVVRPDR